MSTGRSLVALAKRFKNRRLARGTVINIYGAAVGRVGTSVKFTIRMNGSPGRSDGCINPAFKRISCLSVNPFSRLHTRQQLVPVRRVVDARLRVVHRRGTLRPAGDPSR